MFRKACEDGVMGVNVSRLFFVGSKTKLVGGGLPSDSIIPSPFSLHLHPPKKNSKTVALRIRKPLKNGYFEDPKTPLLYRFKPFHWRVQGFLGCNIFSCPLPSLLRQMNRLSSDSPILNMSLVLVILVVTFTGKGGNPIDNPVVH